MLDRLPCLTLILASTLTIQLGGCPPIDPDPSAGCSAWTEFTIQSARTISAGCYTVAETIEVSDGGTLTIAPGTTLRFAASAGLKADTGGAIIAAGTAAQPILLTGRVAARGGWRGVWFADSLSDQNVLEHVTIEFAGGGGPDEPGSLTITQRSSVAVRHTTVRDGARYGFYIATEPADSRPISFESSEVTANAYGPGYVAPWDADVLSDTTTFSGNDEDVVEVGPGTVATEAIWAAIDVDYRIMETVALADELTIAPGAQLVFANAARLEVESAGTLIAEGTATEPILMTGETKVPGAWEGIWVHGGSRGNSLRYVTLEYAGAEVQDNEGALTVLNGATFAVEHCTIRYSARWGIWTRGATLTNSNNTFTGNELGDVHEE